MLRSVLLFLLAALAEISGAYLIWQWQRASKPLIYALLGAVILFTYALIQTSQTFSFGRAFAAYGAVFIAAATLWGWWVDGHSPDRWDWIGAGVSLAGAAIIVFVPRL